MEDFQDSLERVFACREAREWVGNRSKEEAWKECKRGDWMLWIAKVSNVDLKVLTLAKVRCASLVKHLMKDERSLKALEVAEKFALGEATREELDAAAYAAYAAYAAADADAADAAAAAYAAADAAAYADYADYAAREDILSQAADICRETIPLELIEF